ncbi:CRISPR-associated RAMP protein, Csm5 family [Thermodesulfobacterium geofontis OPF15]|uniref:CRISPR system Cms protein Csm5 n=1 Tax=Thermodesulfobacterium geofontis (strain OPF15) TaxID=795359 RepID=F8C650_THEGP|nr:type III-A CRISPR-associated RAMP protein Csm5 [Thermodesulfobacterium geofontis]AEH23201.1 CRISPR-associated RAMP protein, Csm5 family [Thermodesulfobacterium geofontis OPF15]
MELITLSPLHIGDGEELIPFEYIEEDNKVKIYPFDYFIDKLYETYKEPKDLLPKLIELKETAKNGLKENLKDYFKKVKISISPKYEITTKVGIPAENNIKTFIKNLEGPYIPGSEIKGALRTVFLYGILKKDIKRKSQFLNQLEKIKPEIEKLANVYDEREKKEEKRKVLESISKLIENLEREIFRANQEDAQYDLFKAITVSDSFSISYNDLYIDAIRVLNSSRDLRSYSEILKGGLRIKLDGFIDEKIALEGLKKLTIFNEKFKNQNIEKVTWQFLKESAIDFYSSLIEKEKNYVKNKVKDQELKNSLLKQLEKLEVYIREAKNSSKIIIPLRIGQHQGYLSITIMQLVKEERPDLFDDIFKVSAPQVRCELNKTRRVVESEGKFLGWCFLYIE